MKEFTDNYFVFLKRIKIEKYLITKFILNYILIGYNLDKYFYKMVTLIIIICN